MWKRLLVLAVLVQWNLITSEPVTDEKTENVRASRQLNFGDCCPCPGQDASRDEDTAGSLLDAAGGDDSCPCRSTSDAQGASSIFRPAFRAVEPLMRPVLKKEDPKPLLNPEVDLASSVLETLREVTDQEYQEALVRDAAKSVLKLMEPELPESQPRNVVNIIVTPKDRINDDTISEASEVQGSSCVPPPLSRYNDLDNLRLHSPKKLLKQILSPPTPIFKSNGISNRNRNDMDGSASNAQELLSKPLKSNIFENMKTRLNLLNLKPLLNIDNRDFITTPKILQKYNLKNNIRDRMQLRNKPSVQPRTQNILTETRQDLTKNNVGTMDIQPTDVDINQASTVLVDKSLRPDKANILQNTDCLDTISEPKGALKDNIEDLDVVPSPSEVVEVKSPEILKNFHDFEQDREADTCNDKVLESGTDASYINPSTSQTLPENNGFLKSTEVATEVNSEDAKNIEEKSNDSETNHATEQENVDYLKSESSSTKNVRTDLKNSAYEDSSSSTEDETHVKNADSKNSKELFMPPTGEKQKTANSKMQTLPNIKADILKTLEKFKQANEKIQEKLRSNVQDALQLVITNKPPDSLPPTATETYSQSEIRASSLEQPKDDNNFTIITSENNSNAQDFENISESQLEQSTLKDNNEASVKSDCEIDLNQESAEVSNTYVNDDMITSPTSLGEINYPKPSEDEVKRMSTEDLQKMSDSLLERSTLKDDGNVATESDEYEKNLKDKSAGVDKEFDNTITSPVSLGEINYPKKPFEDQKTQINTEGLQNMSDSLLERSTLKDGDKASLATQSDQNVKKLKEKSAEVEKVFDDMITSPTSFDETKYSKTFKDRNSYFDSKDNINIRNKPDIADGNVCAYNMPKNIDSTNIKNADNEMNSQPSNSVFNRISQTDLNPTYLGSLRDFAVEPEDNINPMEGIKDFFNSFRSLGRNTLTNGDDGSNFFTNHGLFGFKNDDNMASSKSFTRGDTSGLNSDHNLNSFKAKVASPKSLDIGSLVPTLANYGDNDGDVLGFASQSIQQTTNFKNVLENNLKNGLSPLFKTVQSPKMLQDTFNSLAPKLSDSFNSHKDNAIKTFRETLDVVGGDPFSIDKNNLLGRPLIHRDDLFGAVLKTHDDFHDKLQAFHSDLNRRFGSINPRISSLGDTQLLGTPSKLKNTKTRAFNKNTATMPANLKPISRNMLFSKNKPTLESIKNKLIDAGSRSSKVDMLKPNNKPKLGIMQRSDSGLKKGSFNINPPRNYGSTKLPTKNNIKLKPLKENKVTISFATTTTRPDSLKFRSSAGSKLPKLTKTLKDNKLKASKLESKDPRSSASEISTSRAQLPDTSKKSKMVPKISSFEESLDSSQNDDNRHLTSIPEANNRKDLLLSKIKNAFTSRSANDDTRRKSNVLSSRRNENILDATQSASTNIDTSISATSLVGDTVKDNNRSFQCKMVCIKDIIDSTDAYKT